MNRIQPPHTASVVMMRASTVIPDVCCQRNKPLPGFAKPVLVGMNDLGDVPPPPAVKISAVKATGIHTRTDQQTLKMHVTIDTVWVSALRHLVVNTFSGIVSSIRIQPVDHARKMKVCLCFNGQVEDRLMSAIMRTLPSAEFGRITVEA